MNYKFGDRVFIENDNQYEEAIVIKSMSINCLVVRKDLENFQLIDKAKIKTTESIRTMIFDETQKSLSRMIASNAMKQIKWSEEKSSYLDEHYKRLFCTILFDNGRGTGKSSAIASIATKDDLIIVPNFLALQRMDSKGNKIVANQIQDVNLDRNFNRVFWDSCGMSYDRIYSINANQYIIIP